MRRVWIEMCRVNCPVVQQLSPSMRRVWIEMMSSKLIIYTRSVTLHAEGVD